MTMMPSIPRMFAGLLMILVFGASAACGGGTPTPVAATPTATLPSPTLTPTPFQPSPTPQPLAARVNGEEISLAEYQAELARYTAAVGTQLATEDEQRVLNSLIDETLLSQAAAESGFTVADQLLQERIDQLTSQLGSSQALLAWMAGQGYTEETFHSALARSIAAAWMRDQVSAGVPLTAEQVHARQIMLYNSEEANSVLARLRAGEDFGAIAAEYDPLGQGDLGWFPRGYLPDAQLEEAAFRLQPGEFSEVVQTGTGYHIVQVIERDPARPLTGEALYLLQYQALQAWMKQHRAQSDIQVLLP